MPAFTFEAVDKHGRKVTDQVEAGSKQEAKAKIQALGYYPSSIRASDDGDAGGGRALLEGMKHGFALSVSHKQLTHFTSQFSTLQDAGLPIVRSLRILEGQMKGGLLKHAVTDVAEDVEGGESLSESMEKHPRVFNLLYVSMVRAGEMGGVLDTIFRRLAEFMERAYKVRRQIIGAMIYPVVVVMFAVLLVTALLIFIVPRFQLLFVERKLDLPTPTALLIKLSEVVKDYWWLMLLGVVALAGLYVLLAQLPKVRFFLDSFKLRAPLLGGLTKKSSVSRFARTLGTLLASGVPILDALRICRDAIGNARVASELEHIHDGIKEGEAMAVPMADSTIFDDVVVNMVDVGEQTGELDKMLIKVADNYDLEVEVAVDSLVSTIEPILIVALGGIVGFIVLALFWPLMKLIQTLQ
ncbi:MAG: type II secretion system F family protein [Planctomycetota bacterium]|jgi:type IV pilus assembly protein PilC